MKDLRKFPLPEANTLPTINMVLDKTGAGLCPRIDGFFAQLVCRGDILPRLGRWVPIYLKLT
jgi:hypothetical protein